MKSCLTRCAGSSRSTSSASTAATPIALDPLANLLLTVDGQRAAHAKLHDLAHELCDGRWLATGGGGYELVQVVPRSWTHLLAIATGEPIDPGTPTPQEWRDYVSRRTGREAPTSMSDLQGAVV